jgi:hypothetical protein
VRAVTHNHRMRIDDGKGSPMAAPAVPKHLVDTSLPDLVKRLANEGTTLAKQELEVVTTELRETADKAKATGKTLGVTAVIGLIAVSALTTAAVLALALVVPGWLAGLIIGVPLAIIALIMGLSAKAKIMEIATVPERTMQAIKDDLDWVNHQLSAPGRYNEVGAATESGAIRARMNGTVAALVHQVDPKTQVSAVLKRVTDRLVFIATSLLRIIQLLTKSGASR